MGKNSVFSMSMPELAFGTGALGEVGSRASAAGIRHAALMTDENLAAGPWVKLVRERLVLAGVAVSTIGDFEIEPTNRSFLKAAADLKSCGADGIVSLGGGSVMDTAKAANLYACAPADFDNYVNAPIGKGLQPSAPLLPHIACPTTCGTGSECTGIAVFDYLRLKTKTGIMSRRLVPNLAIIDPDVTTTMPLSVLVSTALDAISHALEAYTCRSFAERDLPEDPAFRPMTQGANAWSDAIAEMAIKTIAENMRPAMDEHSEGMSRPTKARGQLMWAATLAGNAFGNAGCHLPHAMSYPVSAMVRNYRPTDWPPGPALIPHGLSVLLTAPACYRMTAKGDPKRHRDIAQWLGQSTDDPGDAIASWVEKIMDEAGLPRRLGEIGFVEDDLADLLEGAMPQRRLLDNAPIEIGADALEELFRQSL